MRSLKTKLRTNLYSKKEKKAMLAILGNMVWPALYISEELRNFWFLVFGTVAIEIFTIKSFLKYSWAKSTISSVIGNLVSGFVGTFIMMWAMLVWHGVVDDFVSHATFDTVNWVATYLLMCVGSVLLEALTVSIVFKDKIKRLFLPLLTGNLLTYIFIAFSMATVNGKDSDEISVGEVLDVPIETLLDLECDQETGWKPRQLPTNI